MVSPHRSGALRRRSVQTLRKAAGGGPRQTLLASCRSRWGRQVNWSIILFWLRISGRRGPRAVAAALSEEDAEHKQVRQRLADQLRIAPSLRYEGKGRPTKRERRDIERLKADVRRQTSDT